MKYEEIPRITRALADIPSGTITFRRCGTSACTPFAQQLAVDTTGKGCAVLYPVFPGAEASFHTFLACEISFHHPPAGSMLGIYYCRSGRVGWNMHDGTAVYLGAGDLTLHSMQCCANSVMTFPLGYAEGISFTVDLNRFERNCPPLLRQAGVQADQLRSRFCQDPPAVLPASPELEHIFAPLCTAPRALRQPLLELKVQELLLYLSHAKPFSEHPAQYFSRQTEQIKEIHRLLTEDLKHRFTIEELSKRYLINTSTLKEVFKAVYGLPIATYMKEYRVRRAMELLRDTNASIADIAAQVGYESQGKFTKAFKDVAQVLPTEYRKMHLLGTSSHS